MMILPAIDLREGRCVRLFQGRLDQETVFSHDPAAVARGWQEQGAEILHLVDLDGAFAGEPKNLETVKAILAAITIPVQLGGGIRSLETIEEILGLGVQRVILGTAAIKDPELIREACRRYGERIVLGIDARDGKVAIQGWADTVEKEAVDLAREMKELGISRVIYTDIKRDGTLQGPNLESTRRLARESGLKVIASGGFSSLEDIRAAKAGEADGVDGCILGKALYSGAVTLAGALEAAR